MAVEQEEEEEVSVLVGSVDSVEYVGFPSHPILYGWSIQNAILIGH
jgi:hypothetical protein